MENLKEEKMSGDLFFSTLSFLFHLLTSLDARSLQHKSKMKIKIIFLILEEIVSRKYKT